MDNYADAAYYRQVYAGAFAGTDDELGRLLEAAARKLDALTFNRTAAGGLTDFQGGNARRAGCLLADYISGGTERGRIASYKALDISVSYEGGRTAAERHGCPEEAWALLEAAGLLRRDIR